MAQPLPPYDAEISDSDVGAYYGAAIDRPLKDLMKEMKPVKQHTRAGDFNLVLPPMLHRGPIVKGTERLVFFAVLQLVSCFTERQSLTLTNSQIFVHKL